VRRVGFPWGVSFVRIGRRWLVVVALGATWPFVVPGAAVADRQVASAGQTEAVFSFERPAEYEYTDLRLAVMRAGQLLFDERVSVRGCAEPYCSPRGIIQGRDAVRVRDLDADGEPEVLLDVFTGGAHCCLISWVLRYDDGRYRPQTHDWADAGYRLVDLDDDGRPEFRSADWRFRYQFGSFADSAFPLRVFSYRQGVFKDVTRRHRRLVRADARRWKRLYLQRRDGPYALGVLAGWTADQYLLGRKRAAHRYLEAERRAGRLESAFPGGQGGRTFVRRLKARLRAWGY
jgi:hypothetical protein